MSKKVSNPPPPCIPPEPSPSIGIGIEIGDTALVTTDDWFFAPDGRQYKAVWGTLHGVFTDEQTLGVRTNARSTNWYVKIGDMIVAGCQVHYAIKCGEPNLYCYSTDEVTEGKVVKHNMMSRIYNADEGEY